MWSGRSTSSLSLWAISFVLLVACAGCWEKVEYTGSDASTAGEQSEPPVVADAPANSAAANVAATESAKNKQATDVAPATETTSVAPSPSDAAAPDQPKPAGDRYGRPAAGEPQATTPAPAAEPPKESRPEQPESARHTDAAPVSATVEVAPPAESPNVRRQAWTLGSRLSLAALANDRGMAANSVPGWFEEARSAATLLGTTVDKLPEPAAADDRSPASRQVIDYLIAQGQRIGRDLSKQHGQESAALFEVALKSNILLLLYGPGSSATNSISSSISRAAPQGRLPAELWKPLVDMLGKQPSLGEVRAAVRQMHNDVDQYLAKAAEPSRQ